MRKKRLFIVGAMRSGTTYLAAVLDEHPEICMHRPYLREPKFFIRDDEYSKGLEYYEKEYFDCRGDEKVIGEKTVHYCEYEKAARRISDSYPDSKIIFILRNPVHRAISNYNFSRSNGLESRNMEEVFLEGAPAPEYDMEKLLISPFDYLERGIYIRHIGLYERYFPGDRLKIIIMEKFTGNISEISEIYEYLEVDKGFVPFSIENRIHAAGSDSAGTNPEIIDKLRGYYAEYNRELKNKLGINLDIWE